MQTYGRLVAALQQDQRSDTEISKRSGVSQPTIWRLRNLDNGRVRVSEQFNKLCSFYGINELNEGALDGSLEAQLKSAIMSVWDGSDAHARALIKVVRSLKALGNQPPLPAEQTPEGGLHARHTH